MPNRMQCSGCPWRESNDPKCIPNGLRVDAAELLDSWTAKPADPSDVLYRGMACHDTPIGPKALPCVGWLYQQLGDGNNIMLRLQARHDVRLQNWEIVGPQRESLKNDLPADMDLE